MKVKSISLQSAQLFTPLVNMLRCGLIYFTYVMGQSLQTHRLHVCIFQTEGFVIQITLIFLYKSVPWTVAGIPLWYFNAVLKKQTFSIFSSQEK